MLKIKYLAIAFSIIFIIFIVLIGAFPPLILGPALFASIRNITVPVSIVLILGMTFSFVLFLLNYRLLSLLEREDWPALAYYLEQKVFKKNQCSGRNVRLLASSYLVMTDFSSVLNLESKVMTANPSAIEKNILIFGTARILNGNYKDAACFFKANFGKDIPKQDQWVRWFYGFCQMLVGAFTEAEGELSSLVISSPDAIVTGLSAYFLETCLARHSMDAAGCRAASEKGRQRVVGALKGIENWKREQMKMGTEIYISIIKKYIDEAGSWLYSPK